MLGHPQKQDTEIDQVMSKHKNRLQDTTDRAKK